MSWLHTHWPRIACGAAILAVAAVAGAISYMHIYDLTLALHQPVIVARLMPFAVDGLITIGSVALLQSGQSRLGWLGVGPGVTISLFANIESGIRYGWLSAVWAGIPAVSFFFACFILERWLSENVPAVPATDPVPVPVTVPLPVPVVRQPAAKRAPENGIPEKIFAAEIRHGELPTIRAIKSKARCGTDRARVIRGQLAQVMEAAA